MRVAALALSLLAIGCKLEHGQTEPPVARDGGLPPNGPPPDMALGFDLSLPLCEGAMPAPPNDGGAPSFGQTVEAPTPPAPVSGGTLYAARDGRTAAVSDPDEDRFLLVDLQNLDVRAALALQPGDEPGRVVDDAKGVFHVALRRGGAIADVDPNGVLIARRAVCPSPRGIAYDAGADAIHVACAGGELVSLPAAGGAPTRTLLLDRDLRDVVVDGTRLLVTRFRAAELLVVEADGTVSARLAPPEFADPFVRGGVPFGAAVAWRAIPDPAGGALVLHQRGQSAPIDVTNGGLDGNPDGGMMKMGGGTGYGGGNDDPCSAVLHSAITPLGGSGVAFSSVVLQIGALPVDFVVANGTVWVAAAGESQRAGFGAVGFPTQMVIAPEQPGSCQKQITQPLQVAGQAVAIAVDKTGSYVIVQARQPSTLQLFGTNDNMGVPLAPRYTIALGGTDHADTGHAIFHSNSGSGMACASCHPEGGEDGRTWQFNFGPRRTQSLRGGVSARAPFHWNGDLVDMNHLVGEVFRRRMGGPPVDCGEVAALQHWIDSIPYLPPPARLDGASVARGAALFARDDVGCAACHTGALFTDNAHIDVGTGGAFQVPTLRGLAWRAPYLHDGCAATLADRFGRCATPAHGTTSQLSPSDLLDLATYLDSL